MENTLKSFDLNHPKGNWREVAKLMEKSLPQLYAQENEENPTVFFKLFMTCSNLTWYILEGRWEEDDFLMFGWVDGFVAMVVREISRRDSKVWSLINTILGGSALIASIISLFR